MRILLVICIIVILMAIINYDKWSYRKWADYGEANIKPFTGRRK